MSDSIRLLLQAEIDTRSSLDKINKQIKEIEKQSRKIKLDINLGGDASKAISDINRTIAQTTKVTDTATKSNKKHNKSVYELIHLYRTQQMSTEEFIKSASKYREASKFKMLSDKQQKQLMTQLNSAEKERTRVLNEAAKVKSRIVNEMADGREKANQRRIASEKKWEEAQSRATNKALEDNYRLQQQVEQFQQKMLGTSDFRGQVDIFAQKNRGRINIGEVTKFREEIENLSKLPIEQQSQAMQRLKNQFSAIRSEASQSSSVIARSFENAFKFLRFYLVGGVLTGFVRDMRESIRFVEELDKELTQISIITRMTKDETLDLARSYGELGKEMGKTVTEISKVNTELVRQGLSIDESAKRLDTILKLSATGAIDTQQSLGIITASVNALGEESERAADVMLKASQISASSVEEIGQGFTKTASAAQVTGMSLTELNAIISGLVEVTQESPSSLGNSIKTLLGRFNRINEETGELNESLNDVQKAFESVNIEFLDANGQIRPVYGLLEDLDGIWKDLSKNSQMYIATQAAGIRQQNRFVAIMEHFGRIQEINNELMDSSGTLMEGYSTYLNSVEAAANKARASLETMWINAVSSDAIRSFYLLSSSVLDAIDNIGVLRTVVFGLSSVFLLANKRWREFSRELVTGQIVGASSQISMLSGMVNILGVSFDVAKLKAMGLQAALTFGLSIALSLAIDGITKLIGKQAELSRQNAELIQSYERNMTTYNQNIQRLNELEKSYDSIRDKISKGIELNKEEKDTIDELVQINPDLVQGYNERGDAIIDTTQSIGDMIDELERAKELEDIQLTQAGGNLFEEASADIEDTMRQLAELGRQIDVIEEGSIRASRTTGRVFRNEKDSLTGLRAQYKDVVDAQGENSESAIRLMGRIKEKEVAVANLRKEMELYQQTLINSSAEVQNALFAHARLNEAYSSLSGEVRRFVADYIRSMNVLDFEDFIDMQLSIDEFIKSLSNAKFSVALKDYSGLVKELESGSISAAEFDEKLKGILEILYELSEIDEDIITRIFKDSSEIESTRDRIDEIIKSTKDLYNEVSDVVDEYDLFSQALKELNEDGQISKSTLDKLVDVNEDFANAMGLGRDAAIDLMIAHRDKRRQMVDDMIAEQVAVITNTNKKLEAYEAEVIAVENLAKAKQILKDIETGFITSDDPDADMAVVNRMRSRIGEIEEARKQIQTLQGLKSLFDEVDRKHTSSSSTSAKEQYRAEADRYAKINQELDKNNILLQRNKTLQDLAGDDLAKKIKLMEEEIKLNEQRQKILNQLNNERRREAKELENVLSKQGFKFAGEGDNRMITNLEHIKGKTKEVEEAFNRYMQIQKDEIPKASQDWWDLKSAIEKVKLNKLIAEFELVDRQVQKLKKSLSQLEYEFKLLEDTDLEGKADNIAKQMAIVEREVELAKNELELMGEVGEDTLQAVKDRQEELNKRIQEGTLAINNFEQSLKDLRETARQNWIRAQNDLYNAQQERLQALDRIQEAIVAIIRKRGEEEKKALEEAHRAEMDSLEKRHNERKKRYQEDLDEFRKYIQAKIDELDEQYEEEDYLEQLNKEREEAVRLQREIDVLSLDDSLTARNKVTELRKQLADQNEKIAKMQQKRERDLLKKSLQDQLKDKEKNAKEKDKIADELYENEKKRLEEEYRINKEFLERKYSDEQVYAEARESIMRGQVEVAQGVFEDIYDAYVDFENKFGRGMGILGDIIRDDFIKELEKAQDAIRQLDYLASNRLPNYDSDYDPGDDIIGWREPRDDNKGDDREAMGGKLSDMTQAEYEEYRLNKKLYEDAKKKGKGSPGYEFGISRAERNAAIRAKYGIKEDLYSYDDLKNIPYEQLKILGYDKGGRIDYTGFAMVHGEKDPEWILRDHHLQKIISDSVLSTVKITTPKIPKIVPRQSITYHIDKIFDISGTVTKDTVPLIRKEANNIEETLKNLNKSGVFRPIRI